MWLMLLFNAALFGVIVVAHFYGNSWHRAFLFFLICVVAFYAAIFGSTDPFAVIFYAGFAFVALRSVRFFKAWAMAQTSTLDEQLQYLTRKSEIEVSVLDAKNADVQRVEAQFNQISHLYDKIKEMSQSFDFAQAFLIFGEALHNHFEFDEIKFYFLSPEGSRFQKPEEIFSLKPEQFSGVWDRSVFLKTQHAKLKSGMTPFEEKVCQITLEEGRTVWADSPEESGRAQSLKLWPDFKPLVAYPIYLEDKIFAVLAVYGVSKKQEDHFSVLAQRFVSECQRIKLYQQIQMMAMTDGLTGAYIRRHLLERLDGEIDRSKKFGLKLSFLMIDVDFFKKFNDDYGHLVGDAVLRQTSDTIKKSIRELDLLGRYGGEEFGVILIETDQSEAFLVAERIRLAVASRVYEAYDEKLKVTVSIGCATFSKSLVDAAALIEAADVALYKAKEQGRNRVFLHNLE